MIVYKVTNKSNSKSYIGITTRDLEKRWKEHCHHDKSYLAKSIDKYGKINFDIEVVDTAMSQNELMQKEQKWIKECDTVHPNGYNLTTGGQLNMNHCEETRKKMSIAKMGANNPNFGGNTTAVAVYCVTNNTWYESATDAARKLNLTRSNIVRVMKKERKHAKGYVFEYKKLIHV